MKKSYVVSRITVIPDELDIIASTVNNAFQRKPKVILTSGGLGPTFDDMTLKGVAQGLSLFTGEDIKLELNEEALVLVKARYARSHHSEISKMQDLNPARKKMAFLPKNATPVKNPAGSAPGIRFRTKKTTIYCMPGVPRELESMFVQHILPDLEEMAEPIQYYEGGFLCKGVGESNMAAKVTEIQDAHPEVYIKSHPRLIKDLPVELHVTSFESQEVVDAVLEKLKVMVKELGGSVAEIEE